MNAASMGITGTIDGGEQVGPTIHRRNSALDGDICEDGGCSHGKWQVCIAFEAKTHAGGALHQETKLDKF